jgi:hypothetical protein
MKRDKLLIWALVIAAIVAAFVLIRWYLVLKKAHGTFEDYYAFRCCAELLERGSDYGICRLHSGAVIKIVKFQDRWFLDGDLPCKSGLCF